MRVDRISLLPGRETIKQVEGRTSSSVLGRRSFTDVSTHVSDRVRVTVQSRVWSPITTEINSSILLGDTRE
jgi:hypothetical protein